jgi:methyltransferase (TIGR00027 family)
VARNENTCCDRQPALASFVTARSAIAKDLVLTHPCRGVAYITRLTVCRAKVSEIILMISLMMFQIPDRCVLAMPAFRVNCITVPLPLIRSISDTANWVAYHRATESDRPDAIFHDPFARRLAGEIGEALGRELHENAWAIAVRTYLFDNAIRSLAAREPIGMVINLAAGLDSRPYRLELPSSMRWVEVDLPEISETKRSILCEEKAWCRLDVITQDLADRAGRRALFADMNRLGQRIAVISEGLLCYLDEDNVTALAADLHEQSYFTYWLVEVISPRVLEWINRKWKHHFEAANALMRFAPSDWRKFYADCGWAVVDFKDMAQTAREVNREPGMMKMFRFIGQMFPGWGEKQRKAWESGVAVLRRA